MSSYWKDNFEYYEDAICELCRHEEGAYDFYGHFYCEKCCEEVACDHAMEAWAIKRLNG